MTAQPVRCIWCQATHYKASLEHIVPEAIGCPDGFTLAQGVCVACNSGLGHLDRALLRQFEVIAFLLGIPRKGGRRPTLESWGGLAGQWTDQGPELHLNAGPDAQDLEGRRLSPSSARTGIHEPRLDVSGTDATASFKMVFGDDPKFTRAIYKIALGTVAYFLGPDTAAAAAFDPVRAFVRKGEGSFQVLMLGGIGSPASHVAPPWSHPGGLGVPMTLLGIDLIADLDPQQRGVARMVAQLTSEARPEGWSLLPPDDVAARPPKRRRASD